MVGLDDPITRKLAIVIKDCEGAKVKIVDILSGRLYFSLVALELYANVNAIIALVMGSEQVRNGTVTRVFPSLLVLSSTVFLLREALQITSVGIDYIGDVWSWYEIVCITFLLMTAHHMFNQIDDPELEPKIILLSFTGFLIVVQAIFYLRSTVLPFARFVGGLLIIARALLPFLIVSLMLIAAFIYIYWMTGKGSCDTLLTCTQTMLSNIFNFVPVDVDILDFLFCLVIIIVLLNVVIAIVSEAWTKAALRSTELFWKYRLEKVGEFQFLNKIFISDSSDFALLREIDNFDKISYSTSIIWSNPPYNDVVNKSQYDKPEDYFDSNVARKIRGAKSLQSDLYWSKIEARSNPGGGLEISKIILIIVWWLCKCVLYIALVSLGMITGGFFFPKNFRSALMSIGIRTNENDDFSESSQTRVHPTINSTSSIEISKKECIAGVHSNGIRDISSVTQTCDSDDDSDLNPDSNSDGSL